MLMVFAFSSNKRVSLPALQQSPPDATKPTTRRTRHYPWFEIFVVTFVVISSVIFSGILNPAPQFCYGCPIQQLNITSATININASSVSFGLANTGTRDVIITQALVTGGSYYNRAGTITGGTCAVTVGQATIPPGTPCSITVTFVITGSSFVAGTSYAFTLISTKGDKFPYTATA